MHGLMQDWKGVLRQLGRRPFYVTTAVVVLALGIGACTLAFTFVRGVILAPLPYPDADRIVSVTQDRTAMGGAEEERLSIPAFATLREESVSLAHVAAELPLDGLLADGDGVRRVSMARVSSGFLSLFGGFAETGREFGRDDELVMEEARLAILSHQAWISWFGADPDIVGRETILDEVPHRIVGVARPGFTGPRAETDIWVPLRTDPEGWTHNFHLLHVYGRLAPAASPSTLDTELTAAARVLAERFPASHDGVSFSATSLREVIVRPVRSHLLLLFAGVGTLLLLACLTAGNLVAAGVRRRRRELAVRAALGASRGRILRLPALEAITLSAAAGVAGALLAAWGLAAARGLAPSDMPRLEEVRLDPWVLLFVTAAVLVVSVIIAVLAAAQARRLSLSGRIAESPSTALRSGFVVGEVAVATGLTVLAVLLVRSYLNLQAVDPGFTAEGVIAAEVTLPAARYGSEAQRRSFFEELLAGAREVPGFEAVGETDGLPLRAERELTRFRDSDRRREITAGLRLADPGYFRTMRIPLVRGEMFAATGDPFRVVVSETFASRLWPDDDPVGRRVQVPDGWGDEVVELTVVGVVGDVRESALSEEPEPGIYLSPALIRQGFATIVVRASGDPLAAASRMEALVHAIDPTLPPLEVFSLRSEISAALELPRIQNRMFAALAALALLLALGGAYGVAHLSVASRVRELGIRMAVGAAPSRLLRLVLTETGARVVAGIALGLLGAASASQLISGFLYGVEPTDVGTFLSVGLLVLTAGILAAYLPARRAARVDPMIALRAE